MSTTPNMNLLLPDVGLTLGPLWASEVNAAFGLIDSHTHVSGQGVPVPTAGININADFPFNGFNATTLRSVRFNTQPSPLSGVADLTCLYVSNNNLYYNNGIGQQVQITQGAGLDASTVGGFGGDYGTSTASAFYTSATSTFTFWQAPSQSALMDMGPLVLHNTDQITNGVTFQAPLGLTSSYQLTLPSGLPSVLSFLMVNASGNISDTVYLDNATLQIVSNVLQVPTGGITDTQIAAQTITVDKQATMPISTAAAVSNGILQTLGSGTFTTPVAPGTYLISNLSGSLVTNGRPIYISLGTDNSLNPAYVGLQPTFTAPNLLEGYIFMDIDGTAVSLGLSALNSDAITGIATSVVQKFPASAFSAIVPASAGNHPISVYIYISTNNTIGYVYNTVLTAYEI